MSEFEIGDDRAAEDGPRVLSPGQFSIGSLLLLTLWIAICLGIYRLSPVIGGALGIWTVPGAIRALVVMQIWRRRKGRLSWGDIYDIFGNSLMLSAAAEIGAVTGAIVGGVFGLAVASAIGLTNPGAALLVVVFATFHGTAAVAGVVWWCLTSRHDQPV
jgi:hypothetical protein